MIVPAVVLPPPLVLFIMVYDIDISLVDYDTGEVVYSTKITSFVPSSKSLGIYFHRWLDCFVRGLLKGNNLSIQFTATLKTF